MNLPPVSTASTCSFIVADAPNCINHTIGDFVGRQCSLTRHHHRQLTLPSPQPWATNHGPSILQCLPLVRVISMAECSKIGASWLECQGGEHLQEDMVPGHEVRFEPFSRVYPQISSHNLDMCFWRTLKRKNTTWFGSSAASAVVFDIISTFFSQLNMFTSPVVQYQYQGTRVTNPSTAVRATSIDSRITSRYHLHPWIWTEFPNANTLICAHWRHIDGVNRESRMRR